MVVPCVCVQASGVPERAEHRAQLEERLAHRDEVASTLARHVLERLNVDVPRGELATELQDLQVSVELVRIRVVVHRAPVRADQGILSQNMIWIKGST